MNEKSSLIRVLNTEIVACRKCARLVKNREKMAREKRRAYRDWEYWGKAVPGFGDSEAPLLILGLAPAAHGANRTGRMFTGDDSGTFVPGSGAPWPEKLGLAHGGRWTGATRDT